VAAPERKLKMCLSSIKRKFKKKKKVIGYKVVKYYGKVNGTATYGPIYYCKNDRWKRNKWYVPNYSKCTFRNRTTGTSDISRWGKFGDIIKNIVKTGKPYKRNGVEIVPMANGGWGYSGGYECGFHYFQRKAAADGHLYKDSGPSSYHNYRVAECEFKEIITEGEQWYKDCGVARKMKINKIFPINDNMYW
jgi:hypothetical protein